MRLLALTGVQGVVRAGVEANCGEVAERQQVTEAVGVVNRTDQHD